MVDLKAIIFDLDGTLYTSNRLAREIHTVMLHSLARQIGIQYDEAEKRFSEAKSRLTRSSGWEATMSDTCRALGGDIKELHKDLAAGVDPEPFLVRDERVVDMLKRLGKGFALYIYTNNNLELTTRIMAAIGIGGFFRKIFSVEDFWRSKPDRKALEMVYDIIALPPADCLFVGDRFDVDLRRPQEFGSRVFLTATVEKLLTLESTLSAPPAEVE
jgi:putative hydrolase of the HAD superfamily